MTMILLYTAFDFCRQALLEKLAQAEYTLIAYTHENTSFISEVDVV